LLLGGTVAVWALGVLPEFAPALGLITVYNLAVLGPTSGSVSGFSSPGWFLLVGVLALGAALNGSGLLRRLALTLLLVFPPTFRGQVLGLLVGGLLITPLLPLTVARCALTAPLAVSLAGALGYEPGSRSAAGIGLAAFAGAGLLSRGFLTGATLNLIAWSLLPVDARPSWALWALAAAPMTLCVAAGAFGLIVAGFGPEVDRRLPREAIEERLLELGALSRAECLAGAVTLGVLAGLVVGPSAGVEGAWVACVGALVLVATGVLTREHFRSAMDWPLLVFLGVILSLPAIIRHAGLDARMADALPLVLGWAHASPARAVVVLFLFAVCARVLLSEWVGIPLLTLMLLPVAPALALHPWVVAFVILVAGNLWLLPYQFTPYVAFLAGSDGRLFSHRQVWGFSGGSLALSLPVAGAEVLG